MAQRVGTAVRMAVLVGVLFTALALAAQIPSEIDYALELVTTGVAYPSGELGVAFVVKADWSTNEAVPFVVQLTLPRGLEPARLQCSGYDGQAQFDPATRVLTWADSLDNPFIAFESCPLYFGIDPTVPPGTIFSLTATLTTSKPDPKPANNTVTVEAAIIAAADLVVASFADRDRVKPGETITYTLHVHNFGPQTAQNVRLTDHISGLVTFVSFEQLTGPPAVVDAAPNPRDGDCFPDQCSGAIRARLASLPPDTSAAFRLVVVANTDFESADIRNRLVVDSEGQVELADNNNVSNTVVFAGPSADLAITSRLSDPSAGRSTVLLQVSNAGPETVNGVTVHNILATAVWNYSFVEMVRYVSATPSQGTCNPAMSLGSDEIAAAAHPLEPASWSLDCQLGMLAPGAVGTIALVIESSPGAGLFLHSAEVRPTQNDPRRENNFTELTSRTPRRRSARH